MVLSVSPKIVTFTGEASNPKSRRDKVEDAATATGGVGAGVAATRGGALKFFKSAEKINQVTGTAAKATSVIEKPAKQTVSLLNAFKVNYRNFTKQVAEWAEASKMPKFMKGIFTGKLGNILGKGAAVFVFISGIGEVIHTLLNNLTTAGATFSTPNSGK